MKKPEWYQKMLHDHPVTDEQSAQYAGQWAELEESFADSETIAASDVVEWAKRQTDSDSDSD